MNKKDKPDEKLKVEGNTIYWEGSEYDIMQVKHLAYQKTVTTQRVNYLKVGETYMSRLQIEMDDGKYIVVKVDNSTIFIGWSLDKGQQLSDLEGIYSYLCHATFENRLRPYAEQFEKNGFCDWGDGCAFYPNDKIVISGEEYPLKDYIFIKSGYALTPHLIRKQTLVEKVKGSFKDKMSLDMRMSPDVLSVLLHRYMGISV